MMRMLLRSVFVFFGILTSLVPMVVQAQQGQSGFISIGCGLPANSSYTEQKTGINYISDAAFIDTGIPNTSSPQQLSHVRSFPSGIRNCYKIKVTSGTKYLIRASFLYGNYDGRDELPRFDIHLGPNLWDTVKLKSPSVSSFSELIHSPLRDYVHICLVNTGTGTPFISAIELRVLDNSLYPSQPAASLGCFLRLDFGSINNFAYRYKDDVYDRLWEPYSDHQWTTLSFSQNMDDKINENVYQVPSIVMNTAVTPRNASGSLDFSWVPNNVSDQYYFFIHYIEVQTLAPNESRVFNVTLNDLLWSSSPLVPVYRQVSTRYSSTASNKYSGNHYKLSFVQTESSTLPPILSALEIYVVKDFAELETQQDDVDAILNIKIAYNLTKDWQGDPCAPVAYMWKGLGCSFDGTPRITSLNLSSSGLTGHIPSYIFKLTTLESLDLSNNSLNGEVPDFLTEMQSLKVLNLENNNLTGLVPSELIKRSNDGLLSLSVRQNPNLCESPPCNQQINDKSKKVNLVIPILASIAGMLVLLLLVITAGAIVCALKMRKTQAALNINLELHNPKRSKLESKQREYSLNELVTITNNFETILGRGGFGTVYLGFIDDIQVAVKMISPSCVQGYQQFLAEVKLLMRIHHRNLTPLIGYCNEETCIGLIYEYMANGNLDEHLSGRDTRAKFFTWEDRLQIAVDVAQGLEYLHNGCEPPIIHRDVKCANILLNENFQAKLADLGLSKIFPTDEATHVSTIVAGTPGYLDPEYQTSNRLTEKSDVYGFGVVLLKLITGQPVIAKTHDKTHISQLVSTMLVNGDMQNIVDSRLKGDFDTRSASRAVEIAMACVSVSSAQRPYMTEVVVVLKECLAMESARKYTACDTENKDSAASVTMDMATEMSLSAR